MHMLNSDDGVRVSSFTPSFIASLGTCPCEKPLVRTSGQIPCMLNVTKLYEQ
jgi:hypothetical protein